MSSVPVPIYAVIRGDRVLVVGHPGVYDWLAEDDPQQHNCDAMGCSSFEHVIARVPLDNSQAKSAAEPK